jgi:ribosomal protein L11 methyltransferase
MGLSLVLATVGTAPIDFPPRPGNKPAMTLSQISVPLTKEQAYALVDAVMEREDLALTASAHEDTATGEWVFEATTEMLPDLTAFEALARDTLGGDVDFAINSIDPDVNWVAKSLEGLKPVVAGGFYVYGSHEDAPPSGGVIPIRIDAAEAFGTGHHETTTGCLEAINLTLKRRRPHKMLDVGTGTGVLAIALAKRTHLPVVASDIDPIATRTALQNGRDNGVRNLIEAVTAPGLHHPFIAEAGPYDLIAANILAGPLAQLAPAIGRAAARHATIILSGLLKTQAARLITIYGDQDMVLRKRLERGDWATLILEKA